MAPLSIYLYVCILSLLARKPSLFLSTLNAAPPSLVHLPRLTRPHMKHGMTGDLVITRRYLYAYRIFLAWVHCDVT